MSARRRGSGDESPAVALDQLSQAALKVARTARKHNKSLAGDNFYGNKLAEMRADATNAFAALGSQSAGDTSALAELIQTVFSAKTRQAERLAAVRELSYALRTTWKQTKTATLTTSDEGVFPLTILTQANRSYITTIGRQMNGCFAQGWYDACAVMMRRLVEIVIIEAFEHKNISNKIKDTNGDYRHLSDLVGLALAEPAFTLSRNSKRALPKLRDLGHLSAHGRYYHATRTDIDQIQQGCRVVVEEFLHHAGLL
jgi:hypothetical protein